MRCKPCSCSRRGGKPTASCACGSLIRTVQHCPPGHPAAHLDLVLPSGRVRQYSLCGDPDDRAAYRIAVLREPSGRGGSREIHDTPLVGRTIGAGEPRNHFPLVDASRYLFIAGGIGITPMLPMARDVRRRGVPWRLVYGGRTRGSMAFTQELVKLGGDNLALVPEDKMGMLDLDTILRATTDDTVVYCCGPEGLISAIEAACPAFPPPGALHVERFGTASTASPPMPKLENGGTFEVELRRAGSVLSVPPDRTLLEVVRDVVPDVVSSCEEGFCGACETAVLEGVPEHHDTILSDDEHARSETMMICVGRSKSPRLVLDL